MQFTIVKAEPTYALGANWEFNEENWGESAIIVIPHNIIKNKAIPVGSLCKKGEMEQNIPEQNNAPRATNRLPIFEDQIPPITQPKKPATKKEKDQISTWSVTKV